MITEIKNFITDEENKILMNYFNNDMVTTESTDGGRYSFIIAKSKGINPAEDKFLQEIFDRMLSNIGKTYEYIDYVFFTQYDEGGIFKLHSDFLDTSSSTNISQLKNGGQREYTFLLYLNDDCIGGETNFPMINTSIKLEKNKMVYWKNTLEDGGPNMLTKHESKLVTKGTKFLVSAWIRQQKVYTNKTLL